MKREGARNGATSITEPTLSHLLRCSCRRLETWDDGDDQLVDRERQRESLGRCGRKGKDKRVSAVKKNPEARKEKEKEVSTQAVRFENSRASDSPLTSSSGPVSTLIMDDAIEDPLGSVCNENRRGKGGGQLRW